MPLRTPNLLMTLGFFQWYRISSSAPAGFSINSFSLKEIAKRLKQKVTAKEEGKRVRVPGIPEFIATTDSEASDAESPHFEDVTGAKVPTDALGGVGIAPMKEVEVEEEEEEGPDVHFKQKRRGEPRRNRVVKKPHRRTPTVIAESESAAVPPSSCPVSYQTISAKTDN